MSPSRTTGATVILGSLVSVGIPVRAIAVGVGVVNDEVGEVGYGEADEAVGDKAEAAVRGDAARMVWGR